MTAPDLLPSKPNLTLTGANYTQPPWYYRAAISVLKPLYRVSVWKRSRGQDNYDLEVAQRFGHQYPQRPINQLGQDKTCKGVIWCHAVSLGETNTVAPLLDKLIEAGYAIWLTNTTQTGFARGQSRFAEQIAMGVVSHSYVPVDTPAVMDTFLAHVSPVAALFVETELWAIMLSKLAYAKIPAVLVNARLAQRSFERYQKIAKVSESMMQNLSLIIAQDTASAKRFRRLGAPSAKIRVAGSLKWVVNHDLSESSTQHLQSTSEDRLKARQLFMSAIKADEPAERELAAYLMQRPIWVAASTHEGEESLVIQAHQRLLTHGPSAEVPLLILVPRHPERFVAVATLVSQSGLTMARRSENERADERTQVYLADSMGELMHWYQAANVAFVGGSLVDIGGHNPIEPLSTATPVIMGPFTESCQQVVDTLRDKGAIYQLTASKNSEQTLEQMVTQLQYWLTHPDKALQAGALGQAEVIRNQNVLTRQFNMIEGVISAYQRQLLIDDKVTDIN